NLEKFIDMGVRYSIETEEKGFNLFRYLVADFTRFKTQYLGDELGVSKEEKALIEKMYDEYRTMGLDEEDIKRRIKRDLGVDDLKFEAQTMLALKEFEDLAVQEHIDKLK